MARCKLAETKRQHHVPKFPDVKHWQMDCFLLQVRPEQVQADDAQIVGLPVAPQIPVSQQPPKRSKVVSQAAMLADAAGAQGDREQTVPGVVGQAQPPGAERRTRRPKVRGLPPHVLDRLPSFDATKLDDTCELADCTICVETLALERVAALPCGHQFHRKCIRAWLARRPTCPT